MNHSQKKTAKNKEKLIKSKERVRAHAEVFTPSWLVKKMCDMLPDDAWNDITKTFLEPACGTGNFLVEIYDRKLKLCKTAQDGLIALASITGVDIQMDNVEESRQRLLDMFVERFHPTESEIKNAQEILKNQIICGNFLELYKQWTEDEQTSLF